MTFTTVTNISNGVKVCSSRVCAANYYCYTCSIINVTKTLKFKAVESVQPNTDGIHEPSSILAEVLKLIAVESVHP